MLAHLTVIHDSDPKTDHAHGAPFVFAENA